MKLKKYLYLTTIILIIIKEMPCKQGEVKYSKTVDDKFGNLCSLDLLALDGEERDVNTICGDLGSIDMSSDNNQQFSQSNGASIDLNTTEDAFTYTSAKAALTKRSEFWNDYDLIQIYTPDSDGDTYLHIAIIALNSRLAILIIEKAIVNEWISCSNFLYQTPLHLAVLTKQFVLVQKLLDTGADVTLRDKDGNTPLGIACRDGLYYIVKIILDAVRKREWCRSKSSSISEKYNDTMRLFSILNFDGYTCLHLAAMNRHISIVNLLIQFSVDVNMIEIKTGRTVLHNACLTGDITLVRTLLKLKSCNINAQAYDGLTPFDLARIREQDDICMILAAAGARYGNDDLDSD